MHNLPFDTVALGTYDVQTLEDTYKALKAKFDVELPGDVELPIKDFDLFNFHNDISVGGTLLIKNPVNTCHLVFIKIHYFHRAVRGVVDTDYYKYQVWGFINMKKDYGRILIRHETFVDRIIGLLHPVELEFKDDKPFSRKFYVCTNDENKASTAMTWNFRNTLMDITDEDVMIETVDKILVAGNNKELTPEGAIETAELILKIASNC